MLPTTTQKLQRTRADRTQNFLRTRAKIAANARRSRAKFNAKARQNLLRTRADGTQNLMRKRAKIAANARIDSIITLRNRWIFSFCFQFWKRHPVYSKVQAIAGRGTLGLGSILKNLTFFFTYSCYVLLTTFYLFWNIASARRHFSPRQNFAIFRRVCTFCACSACVLRVEHAKR